MRYAAAEDQAWLGWWEGRIYRKSPATLVDISHGGAKVIAEIPPPRRSSIYICLDGEHRTEWVEAEVLEVIRLPDKTAQVRMAFRELCPYSFFEVAVFGRSRAATRISAKNVTALASSRVGW
jgi:hypothetical protein